ncbi:hydantoinase/oxoprolinase N-terminal domain-containing protein [Lentzea flaviverrucosa]|uniref:Hydantoinase/oxoprolinase n=1 Tax=Lentzea flaviverrucosa TaxID=200379 RepID=A0A1H9VUU1_9PSEU|nr:hydantoinase/oxoprolinase family protein [Lentzea flaviverrucosa]RDI23621.1 hydantoinase/oxoprolinase-like protein [Lentzea flaviverrucosa]SES25264.1 Hydantoinase/oxoprolinase [Lentzea flaviverrucosa]
MHIGIDVGGTNTDAVLVEGRRVLAVCKATTTADVTTGIVEAVGGLRHAFEPAAITAVMIGTTHFVNAVVEGRGLARTAAVRLGLPATTALPPFVDWPEQLRQAIGGHAYLCHGGHEYDGRVISPLKEDELRAVAADIADKGVRSVAITSVFSLVSSEFERRAAEVLTAEVPGLLVSFSHEIGRLGLLERENATIINAALRVLAEQIADGLVESLTAQGIDAPLYLSQNDGTLMDLEYARCYPVATFSSGPTNSMRGGAFLSGTDDCAVVDVGGTTTDIGVLHNGFPREASSEVLISGVRTNFRMPDVRSVGLGGGSVVRQRPEVRVGPDSVGFRLSRQALVFGGDTLTATDVAVAAGLADIGDASLVRHLDRTLVRSVLDHVGDRIAAQVDRMRTSPAPLPVVLVGGGSVLVRDGIEGVSGIVRPEHHAFANAVGAAIAQVGGEVDRVFTMEPARRGEVLDAARQEAVDKAVAAGADAGTVRIVEIEEVPLAYLPGNASRVRARAVGDLLLGH